MTNKLPKAEEAGLEETRDEGAGEPTHVRIVYLTELHRTLRTGIVGGTIAVGMAIAVWGWVQSTQPWWMGLLTAAIAGGFPSVIAVTAVRLYWRHLRKHHSRIVTLEQGHDPNRTSSQEALPPGKGDTR